MSLSQLINQQTDRLRQLHEVLQQELQTLSDGQVDGQALSNFASQKSVLIKKLEQAETVRRQGQQKLGYGEGMSGARQAARDAGCEKDWEHYLAATERTARLNDLVGSVLNMRAAHNQQMLNIIHQVAEKTLYDPKGRKANQPGRLNTSA